MTTKRLLALTALLFVFIWNSSCKKYVKHGDIEGGLILTFDDNYVDDWYRFLPVLDSFGAKATFYVSHYTTLTREQKNKLKIIEAHGNEIAFHTTHHANLVNLLKTRSFNEVMRQEVRVALDSMHKDGFYPKNFAYPYGQHNEMLDGAMLSLFRSIRLLNGTKDFSQSVCTNKNKSYLRSLNVDESGISGSDINRMLESAKDNHNSVVFLAHKINTPPQLYISKSRLIFILSRAKELGLKFYKVEDICR
jgi:peptidoglycan/xylan/chitin deacetylase (PgdA/CDA1 family)